MVRSLAETGPDNKRSPRGYAAAIIDRRQTAGRDNCLSSTGFKGWRAMIEADFSSKDSGPAMHACTGRGVISAVKMPAGLTAAVDAWAEAHHLTRSDAIHKLVEFGLKHAPAAAPPPSRASIASDSTRIEEIAVHEIDRLLDPELPADERNRRIRRLTEGPPEFSHERIDLPKQRT